MDSKMREFEDDMPEFLTPDLANIPDVLKNLPQWVLWIPKKRDNRWNKVPLSVSGEMAKTNDPTTWASFDDVVKGYRAMQNDSPNTASYGGIGFVFTENDPYVGVDLDKCIGESGSLLPEAREIVDALGSYTERSVSGKGLHIITTGEVMQGKRRSSVEVYSSGRYFTVSGHVFEGRNKIVDGGIALQNLRESLSAKADTKSGSTRSATSCKNQENYKGYSRADSLSDEKLLEKILHGKNSAALVKLWDGDTSDYDDDHSRADLALLSRLVWWCNGNEERADRLFRQSGLCRDKWLNRKYYRDRCFDKLREGNTGETIKKNELEPTETPVNTEEPASTRKGKVNQTAQLYELCSEHGVEVFRRDLGGTYVRFKDKGHHEVCNSDSKRFKAFLFAEYYKTTMGNAPRPEAINGCLALLENEAYQSPPQKLYVRVGRTGDTYYLDLCDNDYHVVEIGCNGWRVIDDSSCPCYFLRTGTTEPLPMPERNENDGKNSLEMLQDFFHFTEDDAIMIYGWQLASLQPEGPYPILMISAEHGAGKSLTSELLAKVVDPNCAPLLGLFKDEQSLFATAGARHIITFDNLSKINDDQSDILCRLATGGGISSRKLYTDGEAVILKAERPTLLNGISPGINRPDLLDRCYPVTLKAISDGDRRTRADLVQEFDRIRPYLLGALLDSFVGALQQNDYQPPQLSRMADANAVVLRAEQAGAIPWKAGKFAEIATQKDDVKLSEAAESHPIASLVIRLLDDKYACKSAWGAWKGQIVKRWRLTEELREFARAWTTASDKGEQLQCWVGQTADLAQWMQKKSQGSEKNRVPSSSSLGQNLTRIKSLLNHVGIIAMRERLSVGSVWILYKPDSES